MRRALVPALGLAVSLVSAAAIAATAPAAPPAEGAAAPRPAGPPRYVPEDNRPPLAFREDFTDQTNETPVNAASMRNKDLAFALYGPGAEMVSKSWHAVPKEESGYVWLGSCTQICAFTLKHTKSFLDMRELSKVTWRTKMTGFHQLRLVLKLADGTMLVSDGFVGASSDWHVSEMSIQDQRWRKLDPKVMNDGPWVDKPDLSKVDEVGFTDLQAGSGHGSGGAVGSSRIDWIEVHARPVPRG